MLPILCVMGNGSLECFLDLLPKCQSNVCGLEKLVIWFVYSTEARQHFLKIQFNESLSCQIKLKIQAYIFISPAGICLHGLRIATGLECSVTVISLKVARGLPGLHKDSRHISIVKFNRDWKNRIISTLKQEQYNSWFPSGYLLVKVPHKWWCYLTVQ